MAQRNERRKSLQRAYDRQQEKIKETEAYIRKYKAGIKSKQARGRQSQLNRLERIDRLYEGDTLHFDFALLKSAAKKFSSSMIYAAALRTRNYSVIFPF